MLDRNRTAHKLRILLIVAFVGLSLVACVDFPVQPPPLSTSTAKTAKVLRVCTSSGSATQMNLAYALADQLFNKYGLDVRVSEIGGGSTAVTALIAGDIDLCQISGAAVVSAGVAGAEVVFVGGVINQQPYYLVTRPDIRTPEDLVGQALAVSGHGTSSYAAAIAVVERFGLVPDQDVAILSIGGQSERMAALVSGNIAGTILSPPQAMLVMADGYNLLFDFAEMENPYQHTAIITTRSFLETHPDLVAGYIRATSEAVFLMHSDKEKTIQVMADYLQLDSVEQAEVLSLTYDLLIRRQMRIQPEPSLPGIQALLDELVQENPQAANFQPENFVDTRILTNLSEEGFFVSLGDQGE